MAGIMGCLSLIKRFLPRKIITLLKKTPVYPFYLKKCRSLSQAGQDFWVINEAFFKKRGGYFVEIGSSDGVLFNNTYLLEKRYAWGGICIEADPDAYTKLIKNRQCITLNLCIDEKKQEVDFAFAGLKGGILVDGSKLSKKIQSHPEIKIRKIKTALLVHVLRQYRAPNTIDYLSIDVEGAEEKILKDFPFNEYTFLSMTIERPSQELHNILLKNGYLLVKVIPGLDSFYIHKSFKRKYIENSKKFYGNLPV